MALAAIERGFRALKINIEIHQCVTGCPGASGPTR